MCFLKEVVVPGHEDADVYRVVDVKEATPENLATFVNYGLSITGSTDFTAWWTGTQFANLFRNEFTVNDKGFKTALKGNSFTFDSQNSFKIGE